MDQVALLPMPPRVRPSLVTRWAVSVALGALLAHCSTSRLLVGGLRFPCSGPPTRQRQGAATVRRATIPADDDLFFGKSHDEELDKDESAVDRDVKVTDQRDINELLKLSNPLKPTLDMRLTAVTHADGRKVERPTVFDLRELKPSRLKPVIFHWRDRSKIQTKAPKQYDEIIQRLLNSGPGAMEELVRANWKMFDRAFFFRLTELKEDAVDEGLKERISALYTLAIDIVKAAQQDMRKRLPANAKDARDILNSMLEADGDTFLWPAPPEAYTRLAECITSRATRAKYEDNWFETTVEIVERYVKKMEIQHKEHFFWMGKIVLQRLITEWLRHDSLWEETDEGRFLYRLMSLSHEQWADQLRLEEAPLDVNKLCDELKIIGENKIVKLPMGSKLQVYAAKYVQGVAEFVMQKDKVLQQVRDFEAQGKTDPVEQADAEVLPSPSQ